ncbi:uncharacterized protein BXZ73DRAFT_98858 [Epithele typhae]|uniref:uncharacterized protein n=1 Tax=Epithele typhae TaxID=378194 RepID=UPI002008B232|nr:uncharacterized protein BXZ73DRAFT_98858 [Epithele typhae]KAH9940422.1 hypothetical protein BXZ73DRAFT_98858 [Epithele typhae]
MLRTLARTSFRRSLHSSAHQTSTRAGPARGRAVLGASAVVASYLVWNTWYPERIALDGPGTASKQKRVPTASKAADASPPAPTAESDPALLTDSAPTHDSSVPASQPPESATEEPTTEGEAAEGEAAEGEAAEGEAAEGSANGGGGGAYDPVTGEINWDCPCLGGMAHGPCGPEFREAFSCFIYSEEDPKGIDCVEKFKAMQTCFREHPDVYGDDIMDDDEAEEALGPDTAEPSAEVAVLASEEPVPAAPAELKSSPPEQKSKPSKPVASTSH